MATILFVFWIVISLVLPCVCMVWLEDISKKMDTTNERLDRIVDILIDRYDDDDDEDDEEEEPEPSDPLFHVNTKGQLV